MPQNKWPGPVTDEVTVADELAFDALPETTRMLAERVVWLRTLLVSRMLDLEEERDELKKDKHALEIEKDDLKDENDTLRGALEDLAAGLIATEDVRRSQRANSPHENRHAVVESPSLPPELTR